MSEENKELVRRFYNEVINNKNTAALDDICAPDMVDHTHPPGFPPGVEGTKQLMGRFIATFPDAQLTIEDLIAEGDSVACRWTAQATHLGDAMGIPPTGNRIDITGTSILRFAGGKCVEHWEAFDSASMMRQLGVGS